MILNLVTGLQPDRIKKGFQVVAGKKLDLAAARTENEVLVTIEGRYESLAALRLVHALDKTQFFQFLQGAVDRYQT